MPTVQLPTLALAADLDPWDRQPDETTHRYQQFRTYLDDGRARTLRKAAETLARNTRYIRAVSSAYRWVERAEAYDKHRDELDDKQWQAARRAAAENDARLLNAAVSKIAQRLTALQPTDLTPADMIRLLDVTMRQRRALFGDPALTVAVTGPGGDPLTVQLAELASMTTDQRRAAIVDLTAAVRRRTEAVAGGDDDE